MCAKVAELPFAGIGWAMAEFHKSERRQAARVRRDNARKRQECRRQARECKRMTRAGV